MSFYNANFVATHVGVVVTSSAAIDDKVGIMTTLGFQELPWEQLCRHCTANDKVGMMAILSFQGYFSSCGSWLGVLSGLSEGRTACQDNSSGPLVCVNCDPYQLHRN